MEDLRIRQPGESPFLRDEVYAARAAFGRTHTWQEYLEAAQRCIMDGEIDIVRDYFIGSGLVFLSHLDITEEVRQALSV